MKKFSGFLYGLLSSASFGFIPLFTIPVMRIGMDFNSILVYRFLFAMLAIGLILIIRKSSFRIKKKEILPLILLAFFYDASGMFLFWGYKFMASGVATTIHFMYPVMTTLLMMFVFKEKKSLPRIVAIGLAIIGVFFLSRGEGDVQTSIVGVFIVLISALAYALYLVFVSQFKQIEVKGLKMTFYVFLFGLAIFLIGMSLAGMHVMVIPDNMALLNLIGLAIIPTVLSNFALIEAINRIGSTLTSVLGAMEPLTAVCIGIFVFGEMFTLSIAVGIVLIISAVTIIILKR